MKKIPVQNLRHKTKLVSGAKLRIKDERLA
jgi:hypothetical protein